MVIFKSLLGLLILANYRWMLLGVLYCPFALAWNATGHRVIAQIAYDHLTSHAKSRFSAYNRLLNRKNHAYSFVDAAVWLDKVRYMSSLPLEIHYIDLPFTEEAGSALPKVRSPNAVTALTEAVFSLKNKNTTARARATALRVLVHVVGDLHQPLHAATRVSHFYPEGDKGGNLVKLAYNPVADTLHAYWDKGAGVLQPMDKRQIKHYAAMLEARWPCADEKMYDFNHWAQLSHQLAIKEAYALHSDDNRLDSTYQRRAMVISESQLALAGCRLAHVLNHIDAA